ncbi:hypothetical protein ACTMTI_54080 [Nonomuraea sp. H19]|uniref:hypothetical protein n=1 Tax=Nonomuraea sp. H19 TaxID=3452206 RepID=UPI003F8A48A4
MLLELVLRRLVCSNLDCVRQTFNEQVPGLAERYARRTPPLATLVTAAAVALAGRAGSALLAASGVLLSRTAVLGALMALPEPVTRAPEAIGVDDFALKRNDRYATIIINAHTHERLEVLDGRLAVTLEAWLKAHPEVKLICRDRSTAVATGSTRIPCESSSWYGSHWLPVGFNRPTSGITRVAKSRSEPPGPSTDRTLTRKPIRRP